jgi:tyrosyl-tRNA synthetase
MPDLFSQSPTLQRTAVEVHTADALRAKLTGQRPLRIKYGVDVTAPFLHIGHAVNLWAMRELQDAGHKVLLLIGDFTTSIGDPTGRADARPVIAADQIERDAEGFIQQAGQVLRTDPEVFEVRRNSEWWAAMPVSRFMALLAEVTHARLIQREMFQRRIAAGGEIYLHELLYPVLQGYDSCELDSDLTIVGSDQLFNELMGRLLAERLGLTPQVVITTAITPGIDGRAKQSKSLGNYIAITDPPRQKFGKAMRLPDRLVADYLRVYTLMAPFYDGGCQEVVREACDGAAALVGVNVVRPVGRCTLTPLARRGVVAPVPGPAGFLSAAGGSSVGCAGPGSG